MIKTKLSKFLLIALMFNLSVPTTIFAQENSSDPEEIIVKGKVLYSDQVTALKTPVPIIDVPQTLSIVTDEDIDIRKWEDVIWAITTRMDPIRDTVMIDNTPIDYLDFASPTSGIGSKMGLDATNKMPGETDREWGEPIRMDKEVKQRIDDLWSQLGITPID